MHLKGAGSECAETRSRAVGANGTYCCAFVLTMLSPSEFGFSPSLFVVDSWIYIYLYIYTSVYIDIYISGGFNPNSSNGETPKEDSAKPASFSLQSRGFKSSFGGAPGEAIVKERNSCGHSLYSQTFLGDCIMSKERPKRNIIQKKYVSERVYFLLLLLLPEMLTDIGSIQVCLCSPRWKRINFPSRAGEGYHHAAWAPFGSNILQNVTPLSCLDVLTITCLLLSFFNLKRQQCLFNVCCSVSSTPTMF